MRQAIVSIIAVIVAATVAVYSYKAQVEAAPADPPRVASNVEECTPIGTAGNQTIYPCDDWQVGKLVYINNFGFLFVVEGE